MKADEPDDPLIRAAKRLMSDSDTMRPYWDKQHDHFWTRTMARITSTVGKWLMGAIIAGAASAIMVYAVQHGWIK